MQRRCQMKVYFKKWKIVLLTAVMIWGFFSDNVYAEEYKSHCYPTEEQIQKYKEDGTWEKRQAYMNKLNHSTPSQDLLRNAIRRESGVSAYSLRRAVPEEWKGMQVTGDANILLVRVEFADIKFANSRIYSEEEFFNMVNGDGSKKFFPYESLNAYYKRSSYDSEEQLNITADQVYTCTLSKDRHEYEWADSGEQELLKEVLQMLDENVDFNNYDANDDGRLDGICINFAGKDTGWGSTWWSHEYKFLDSSIIFDGVTPGNYIFLQTYDEGDSYGNQTLIHEVGHMLGLPDYYSQTGEGIGTTDMMNNNQGDHNGFSKWLLGWIKEENIQRVTKEDGTTEVALSALSVDSPGDNKLIAVIAPEDTSIYSEYFVVQYDEAIGNQKIPEHESPHYSIFHVDAHLNEEGTNFKYDNLYPYERSLIKAVSIGEGEYWEKRDYYVEGDSLTPDTEESSDFYGGSILGFTGIEITDFQTGDSPSFKVSFREKETVDGKLEFQVLEDTPLNMGELTLLSNKPLIAAGSEQMAYYEDGDGNRYPVNLSLSEMRQIKISYVDIVNSLKPQTDYTLVIPAGMFQIDTDVYSEEYRHVVKTGTFPEIETDFTYGYNSLTDMISLDGVKSGFLQFDEFTGTSWNAKLYLFEGAEEDDEIDVSLPISEQYAEYLNLTDLKGVACYDGTIAVEVRAGDDYYNMISLFYKLDQNGKVLAGPYVIAEELETFPAGSGIKGTVVQSGALGAPDIENESKIEVYTIDFKNEPVSCLINMDKYRSGIFALDEESYVVIQSIVNDHLAVVYNNEDEQMLSIDVSSPVSGMVYNAVKAEDKLAVIHGDFVEEECYSLMVSLFNMDGTHQGTREILTYTGWRDQESWKIEKTSWGYTLSNYTREKPHMFYFLDEDFDLISSLQVPDMMGSGTHMGSRFSVKWYDIMTPGYKVAITEPIVDENTESGPDSGEEDEPIKPETEPDKPDESDKSEDMESEKVKQENMSSEEFSESNPSPATGDAQNLFLIGMLVVISCYIILKKSLS